MAKAVLDRIMLVDDDDIDNMLHRRVIERSGFCKEVIAFTEGAKALEFLRNSPEQHVNLIFLDIRMPTMDGFEFLERYKKLDEDKKADAIVVMLSSSQWRGDMERAFQTDKVVDYLEKPLKTETLEKVIREHFPKLGF